jgi:hypothetical protein
LWFLFQLYKQLIHVLNIVQCQHWIVSINDLLGRSGYDDVVSLNWYWTHDRWSELYQYKVKNIIIIILSYIKCRTSFKKMCQRSIKTFEMRTETIKFRKKLISTFHIVTWINFHTATLLLFSSFYICHLITMHTNSSLYFFSFILSLLGPDSLICCFVSQQFKANIHSSSITTFTNVFIHHRDNISRLFYQWLFWNIYDK